MRIQDISESSNFVKIGARPLSIGQAEILLPSFQSILNQVKKFRQNAKTLDRLDFNRKRTRAFEDNFSNVISILGVRGSGKTSILLTLKDYFSMNESSNIILPMIIPEFIGKSNDTLGWILSYLEDEINKIEELDKKERYYRGESNKYYERRYQDYPEGNILEKFNNLCKTYFFRKKSYGEYIQNKNEGTADYIRDKQLSLRSDQLLIEQFKEFIDLLIYKKRILNVDHSDEPLLMLFFDDVDISSERCSEVLDVIRTYLTHKNIVVFVAGDYNTFSESLTLEFLQREQIPHIHYNEVFVPSSREQLLSGLARNRTVLESRKQLSQEFLKKTLPPSLRFEMRALDNYDKTNFKYELRADTENELNKTLSELIIQKLFRKKGNDISTLQEYHFDIFDENPRGLINVYYYLNYLERPETEYQRIGYIKDFLKVLLDSSPKLKEYSTEVYKFIKIDTKSEVTKIEFEYLINLAKNYINIEKHNARKELPEINKTQIIDDIINLFVLGDLISELIGEDGNENKSSIFVSLLNQFNERLLPQIKGNSDKSRFIFTNKDYTLSFLINFTRELNRNLSPIELQDLFEIKSNKDYYSEKYFFETFFDYYTNYIGEHDHDHDHGFEKYNIVNIFFEIYNQDEKWIKDKLDFAFKTSKNEKSIIGKAIDQNLKILSASPVLKDFLQDKTEEIRFKLLSEKSVMDVIKQTETSILQFANKQKLEVSGLLSLEDYKNIIDIGIEIVNGLNIKDLTSTIDYVLQAAYEHMGYYSSKKMVWVSEKFLENIINWLREYLPQDIVYLEFIDDLKDNRVIDYERYNMFLNSLEKRSYEFPPRARRNIIDQINEIRLHAETENMVLEKKHEYFEIDLSDDQIHETLMWEINILIGMTVLIKYFEILNNDSLNYFFTLNNQFYDCKITSVNGINKIKKEKFRRQIQNIQGGINEYH